MKKLINELKKENARLTDENSSLWFLLDELEKSNISNSEYREHFNETFKKLREVSLMVTDKAAEA